MQPITSFCKNCGEGVLRGRQVLDTIETFLVVLLA